MNESPHQGGPSSDELVRDVLETLAAQVSVSPDAYHEVRAEWVRRQRRRKRLGVLIAIVVVALADLIGLWALNRADTGGSVIFDDSAPAQRHEPPVPRIGQP
ncbi:hypothetical protein [Kribbella catacumbae]|uniref:hypothetical protein n=1 Tax=Kribbella catacumbae TaxID=460086 RepID=UPI000381C87F|nr:hypothetical protein [Kribbella catacumbae]